MQSHEATRHPATSISKVRATTWVVMGLVGLAAGSCVELDTSHCLAKGGDLECGAGKMCVIALAAGRAPGDDGDGCATDVSTDFIRLPYGLPAARGADADSSVDTLAGVLSRVIGSSCALDDAITDVEDEWEAIAEIRRRLGKRSRVRASTADLTQSDVDEIYRFVLAVDGWVDDCGGQTPGETDTGGTGTGGTDTDDGTTTDDSGTSSTSTGPQPGCVDDGGCVGDPGGPFCDPGTQTCVTCEQLDRDDTCEDADATQPLCEEGQCVACRGVDETGVCDVPGQEWACELGGIFECAPCTEHAQCASGACDAFVGICFDPATRIVVTAGGAGIVGALNEAAMLEPDLAELQRAVLVLEGTYNGAAEIGEGGAGVDAVAFLAAEAALPEWSHGSSGPETPTLTVSASSRVYLDRIGLRSNISGEDDGHGLRCEGAPPALARVDVRRSRIVQNAAGGIDARNGCELYMENSFVGGDPGGEDGVLVGTGATATITYSTLLAVVAGLRCDGGGIVVLRNSIVLSATEEQPGVECTVPQGGNNVTDVELSQTMSMVTFDESWFSSYGIGDFHLVPDMIPPDVHAAIVSADWNLDDPVLDIDGDPRTTADGQLDYAGADVPQRP